MKKFLSILALVVALGIIIGMSIWIGFPSPQGFDRTAIVVVGYALGVSLLWAGICFVLDALNKD